MTAPSTGRKELLTITACTQSDGTVTAGADKFEVMMNPSEFTHDHSISYSPTSSATDARAGSNTGSAKGKPIGKSGLTPEFSSYSLEKVKFNLVIDGTGVVPKPASSESPSVADQIKKLKSIVYQYVGVNHEPSIVHLLWGKLNLFCRMDSMSVQYTLFKPSGEPLRAKVALSFIRFMSKEEEALKADRKSSDLTHVVEVKAGDTLPLLCYRIYHDSSYYAAVAKVNNIVSFRGLKPGSRLEFPPLR